MLPVGDDIGELGEMNSLQEVGRYRAIDPLFDKGI